MCQNVQTLASAGNAVYNPASIVRANRSFALWLPHKGNCHFLNLNFEHFRRKSSEAEHLLRTQDDFDVTLLLLNRSQCKYDRKSRTKKRFISSEDFYSVVASLSRVSWNSSSEIISLPSQGWPISQCLSVLVGGWSRRGGVSLWKQVG